jgi:hypothetical protein
MTSHHSAGTSRFLDYPPNMKRFLIASTRLRSVDYGMIINRAHA